MADDPLALDAARMRRMGYAVIDMLVEHASALADGPVLRTATRTDLQASLAEEAPSAGRDFASLLERLDRDVLPFVGHFDHPRFFGYIPGSGTWPAALGDLIAAATNIDAGAWREAAGPSQLELTVLDWFRDWIGYPATAAGLLVSGGSAANLTAIACAREALIGPMSTRIVAYASDQTHSSVARAARHLGFRPDQIRVLPTDRDFRVRPADVAAAMDADAGAGRIPFLVIANAGTTNTGAIDPFVELARICHERGVWLHVDGAYGAFAVLTKRGRAALDGLSLADSITLDPHKWLAMPFEVGCLMVRDGATLERAFELHPEYLQERPHGPQAVNFADRGLQLTRASRAIKVWLAIEYFGLDAFRTVIDRAMDLTLTAQRLIEADPRLELVTPASLGILTFRSSGRPGETLIATDRRNGAIVAELAAAGDVLLTSTVIGGRYAIRLCVLNHSSSEDDVVYALDRVAASVIGQGHDGSAVASSGGTERASRQAALTAAWLDQHQLSADHLREVPAFESVDDQQAARFLGTARIERYAAGELVTERWALSRTFYVVLEGRLSVQVDDREVNVLGPGDQLGEIAAIDWGRDFGYGRTATVEATVPSRVLAFPAAALRELMTDNEEVDRVIRRTAQTRLMVR
jgi:glutamate/tyrosine decarboxylase-like PLP-dependent enzyme